MPRKASVTPAVTAETEYERQRNERIQRNQAQLRALRVSELASEIVPTAVGILTYKWSEPGKPAIVAKQKKAVKRVAPAEPLRRSTRQRRDVDYNESSLLPADPLPLPDVAHIQTPVEYRPVSDPEQVVESSVDPSEGTRDNFHRLVFADHPEFRPTMTPKQVVQAGSFGGIYFNPKGGRPGILSPAGVDIDPDEFPADWFEGLPGAAYKGRRYDVARNKYGVKAGQNQADWERAGWITAQDPRGWFHWYCRFYQGRRSADDGRQIGRWAGVAGEKGRWKRILVNKVVAANKHWNDASVSPVIRQTLLHWAYELTEPDFNRLRR
ncbi:hypothetical protein WJX72_011787 [[Myrmecia] bisecta]|uniref:Uncharacterized protein n=1 Tax=[Myrmecia] bisecta TaxID=41462 RepID=A0AAW1P7A7_9CHLO